MHTYISLLRGINVGGNKMIKMDQLKLLYAALGFTRAQNYIQSGNVVFSSFETDIAFIETQLSSAIKKQFGFEVPVVVLKHETLKEILQNNPFIANDPDVDTSILYVMLLKDHPSPDAAEKLKEVDFSPEKFVLQNQVIYLYAPKGYGKTKISNNFFEKRLNTSATSRNWRTMHKLAYMADMH